MFKFLAESLNKYGLAYFDMMDGLGFGYQEKCPPLTVFDIVLCNVGSTKAMAEGMFRSGPADLCSVRFQS
jgi:hypothetical protein